MVYAAVRDVCDEFYWYGTLVPRLWAALGRGCYHHALGVRRDILAARSHGEGVDDGSGPPISGSAASAARWDFEEFEDCDARWLWASDGTCAFEFERGQTYYDFLRVAHPSGLLLRLEENAPAPRRCDPLPVDDHVLPHERFEDSHSPPPSSSFLLIISNNY